MNIPEANQRVGSRSPGTKSLVPENDRWYLWAICKSWDHPRTRVVPLLEHLGIEIHDKDTDSYIRRSDFKNFLYSL